MTTRPPPTPDAAEAHHRRGLTLSAAGDYAGAVAAYTAALRLRPGHADALNNRGAARAALGDRPGAFADYDAALALDPALAAALNNRAVARFLAGDLDAALADLKAAVRIDPASASAYDNCATVHDRMFEHAKAVACYDRAVELYEADGRQAARLCTTRVFRGFAYYHLRQTGAALADLRAAYRLAPRVCAFTVAAVVERDAREHGPTALARCDEYLARNSGDYFTLFRRALTHLALGHRAEFEADYDAALWAPVGPEELATGLAVLKALEKRLTGDTDDDPPTRRLP